MSPPCPPAVRVSSSPPSSYLVWFAPQVHLEVARSRLGPGGTSIPAPSKQTREDLENIPWLHPCLLQAGLQAAAIVPDNLW